MRHLYTLRWLLAALLAITCQVATAQAPQKPLDERIVPESSSQQTVTSTQAETAASRAGAVSQVERNLVLLKLQMRAAAEKRGDARTESERRAVEGTRAIMSNFIEPTMSSTSHLSRHQLTDMGQLIQAHLSVLQKITGLPSRHPCMESNGACLGGRGSICTADKNLEWSCGCATEYKCTQGCESKKSAHLCERIVDENDASLVADTPTSTPTETPPTSNPTVLITPWPTKRPTSSPSPTISPTTTPTATPTKTPSKAPTKSPTFRLTLFPTQSPTAAPSALPTSLTPTKTPTKTPTIGITMFPTKTPTSPPPTNTPSIELMEWHKSKYQAHEHQERAPEAAPHVPSHKDAGIGLTDPLEQAIQLLSEKTSRKH